MCARARAQDEPPHQNGAVLSLDIQGRIHKIIRSRREIVLQRHRVCVGGCLMEYLAIFKGRVVVFLIIAELINLVTK